MKTPQVKQFKRVLYCNKFTKDCSKLKRDETNCTTTCDRCIHSEVINEKRNI